MATSNQVSGSAFNYQYDRFGNRWQQNLTAGSGPAPNYSFNSNNQINGFTYDAAGNVINDGNHTYTYDAEERMIAVDGGTTATYSYDAMGRRFATNVGGAQKEFLFDLNNRVLAMQNAATHSWDRGEIYAGGMHLATYAAQDTYFVHSNWLGTVQARTNSQGAIAQGYTSLPFGDALSQVGMSPTHFTDQDRDSETGLDHFLYRQYSSTQGRWMTPDPGGLGVVDPTNPQSWNRYAYVMNNPVNFIDFVGLECYASDQFGNCTNWGSPDGSNLALLGGYADPFQTVFKSTQVAITSPVKPISTPIDQIRNENGVAVAAYLILGYTWEETFSSTEIIYMIGGSNNNSTDSMSGNSSPQPPPLKPGCTGPALWSGVQAGASDLFVPQGADPSGDIEGLVQDENAQRAVAGGLYVVANSARYLAPAADVAADFIPVVGEVLLAYQVGHALYKAGEAYKESIDQCYSAP